MTKEEALETLRDVSTPIKDIDTIYDNFKNDPEIEGAVAMNLSRRTSVVDTSKEYSDEMVNLLIKISDASDMGARWAVAKNPHTPVDTLIKLSKDNVNLVRALVATNPKTPSEVLTKLFNDEKIVRDGLSGNPATPIKILKILADDSDKMARLRVSENPSTPIEILEKLTKDSEENISKAAQIHLDKRGA